MVDETGVKRFSIVVVENLVTPEREDRRVLDLEKRRRLSKGGSTHVRLLFVVR